VARRPSKEELQRIWGDSPLKIFVTHASSHKTDAARLRDEFAVFGVAAFVAHEDIHPTAEWQTEIENALFSCDVLLALLTAYFIVRDWCDQEVGIAVGRGVPIISIKYEYDPYGFIGKYQAYSPAGKHPTVIAMDVLDLLLAKPHLTDSIALLVAERMKKSPSFESSKRMMTLIEKSGVKDLGISQHLSSALKNPQVRESWGVPERIQKYIDEAEEAEIPF
jgi:hypothetical protein